MYNWNGETLVNESGRHGGKKEKTPAFQGRRKQWGLGEEHEKLRHSLVEKGEAMERQKG